MGYILPVNNYRSQQYAMRLMQDEHYAKISSLHRVTPVEEFMHQYEEAVAKKYPKQEIDNKPVAASYPKQAPLFYENPNPAELSNEMIQVVDRKAALSAYQ